MDETSKENDSTDENTNNNTNNTDENHLQSKTPLQFQNNKNQVTSNEIDQPQTQFSMEIIQTTSPSDITPSTVQTYNPNKKKEPEKFHICEGCCSDTPIRTANSRIGPYSTYSINNKCNELLPPRSSANGDQITLVLDLDETLVHSSFIAIPHSDFSFVLGVDTNRIGVYVCIRPGAKEFLLKLGSLYELVLFTASTQFYADTVVDYIDPDHMIKYRLYRESCTDFSGCFVKDLSRLGRDLNKLIILDNSSVAYMLQPKNAISISSWYDDPEDNELTQIQNFLVENYQANSVYDILVDLE